MRDTLNLQEAAELLKIAETTAQELAYSGELPGAKIGRAWVFLKDDLIRWLREQIKTQQDKRKAAHSAQPQLTRGVVIPKAPKKQRKAPPKLPPLPETISQI
jgi:excisionase family DNA binding protein